MVSGGKPSNRFTSGQYDEATLKAGVLEDEFSMPVTWAEAESRDTWENGRFTAPILKSGDVVAVILVTHLNHMTREKLAFESHGLTVIGAATGWPAEKTEDRRAGTFCALFCWLYQTPSSSLHLARQAEGGLSRL